MDELTPIYTTKDVSEALKCNIDTARDRINQVDYLFYLLDEPNKRIRRNGRKIQIPRDAYHEFENRFNGNFFPFRRWREEINQYVRNLPKETE